MFDPYRKRREAASRIRERRMGEVDFSKPVDGDVPCHRRPSRKAGDFMDRIVAHLVRDRSQFFDEVSSRWSGMFPGVKARPGKWVGSSAPNGAGRLFLRVDSAAALFALRPKLPAIKRKLSEIPGAPARFSVHLEIQSRPVVV